MAKKNINKQQIDNIRDSLDSLINDDDIDLGPGSDLPPVVQTTKHNYVDIKNKSEVRAKNTLTKMLKFYLDEHIIEHEEYITANLRLKEMELSQLIFLMETGERAITTLLTQIDSGELSPRMFEVLATLQKSQLDVVKSQTMYVMAAEEATKKLSRDLDVYSDVSRSSKKLKNKDSDDGIIFRGTKGLMAGIQEELNEELDEISENNEDELDSLDQSDFGDNVDDIDDVEEI